MANILGNDKKEQILALGRLGWPLRRIEQVTGVRSETGRIFSRPPTSRAPQASTCDPYRELTELALGRGRNAMRTGRTWPTSTASPAGMRACDASWPSGEASARPRAHPVIVTVPGEEGQVDYGYSRKSVRLLTFISSGRRWAKLHEETFRRLGGAVHPLPRCARPLRGGRLALSRRP